MSDAQRVTIKAMPGNGATSVRSWRVIDGIPTQEQANSRTEIALSIPAPLAAVQTDESKLADVLEVVEDLAEMPVETITAANLRLTLETMQAQARKALGR